MKINLKNILEGLTLEQAKEWNETSEKFIYIDDAVLSAYDIGLNSLREATMNRVLDEIEGAFETMLKNSPGLQNTQKAST
jgi:hypothetical protein